jgi:hypothetical protein
LRKPFELLYPWEEKCIACFTDLHIDSHSHNREKLIEDLNEAMNEDADIIIGSEVFSNILPKDYKRYTRGKDRGDVDAKINATLKDACDLLTPYVNKIVGIGTGNHDASVIKYNGFDPVQMLIFMLQQKRYDNLPMIIHMGFTGMFRISFRSKIGKHNAVDHWWYHHGKGGGAPVTKGMIDANRILQHWIADVYWVGHKHTDISDNGLRCGYLDKNGTLKTRNRLFFNTAGYSGNIDLREYDETGYINDYSDECFYGLEAQGNVLIKYTPKQKSIPGSCTDVLERRMIKKSAACNVS